jgi:CRISPR/Cas system type I-B associated protein Csh2 (Cas7 group RAMP superfamily)
MFAVLLNKLMSAMHKGPIKIRYGMKYRPLPVMRIQGTNERNIKTKSATVGSEPRGRGLVFLTEISASTAKHKDRTNLKSGAVISV